MEPADLVTASVPGTPVTRADISYVEPDEKKKDLMVQWLVFGREEAANALTFAAPNAGGEATVHTIASGLRDPGGVAFRDGALYVSSVNRVLRFDNIERRLQSPPDK